MKRVCVFFACIALVLAYGSQDDVVRDFSNFMEKYNKVYTTSDEYWMRFENFKANVARSELMSEEGGAQFGITKFADMSPEEFKSTILMKNIIATVDYKKTGTFVRSTGLPTVVDWRDKGAVTAVKDQGQCGSCWAFSATQAIESAWIMKGYANKNNINLSAQQIVDCDTGSSGCDGGFTETAYTYIQKAGGQEGVQYYPYTAKKGSCKFNSTYVSAKIQSYVKTGGNENTVQKNTAETGPLSICIDAAHWQTYRSGVLTARQCCPFGLCQIDHCVQVVGYNMTTSPGYWIVRNSWNTDWGIDGYIYLEMGSNTCGIARDSTWPTV